MNKVVMPNEFRTDIENAVKNLRDEHSHIALERFSGIYYCYVFTRAYADAITLWFVDEQGGKHKVISISDYVSINKTAYIFYQFITIKDFKED